MQILAWSRRVIRSSRHWGERSLQNFSFIQIVWLYNHRLMLFILAFSFEFYLVLVGKVIVFMMMVLIHCLLVFLHNNRLVVIVLFEIDEVAIICASEWVVPNLSWNSLSFSVVGWVLQNFSLQLSLSKNISLVNQQCSYRNRFTFSWSCLFTIFAHKCFIVEACILNVF